MSIAAWSVRLAFMAGVVCGVVCGVLLLTALPVALAALAGH